MSAEKLKCQICGNNFSDVRARSKGTVSLDSLGYVRDWQYRYAFCDGCETLFKIYDYSLDSFYKDEYEIPNSGFDEDQYCGLDEKGNVTYRTDIQVSIIKDIVDRFFDTSQRLTAIDYGCARAQTAVKLSRLERFKVSAFDLSSRHAADWEEYGKAVEFFSGVIPEVVSNFDLVFSFYALEHVQNINEFVGMLSKLVCADGLVLLAVPDPWQNMADLIVCDHVNHFGERGLARLLAAHNLQVISYDATTLAGAQICVAKKMSYQGLAHEVIPKKVAPTRILLDSVKYWEMLTAALAHIAESKVAGVIIHGAGINGIWVLHTLRAAGYVGEVKFADSNIQLHGRVVEGVPVLSVEEAGDVGVDKSVVVTAVAPAYQPVVAEDYRQRGWASQILMPASLMHASEGFR